MPTDPITPQTLIVASFFVASLTSVWKVQYQGLFYLLATIFAVIDIGGWAFVTFLYMASVLFATVIRSVKQ